MNQSWITIEQALKATNTSDSTIRRFVKKHKDNINVIQKEENKVFINSEILFNTHPLISESVINNYDRDDESNSIKSNNVNQSFNETVNDRVNTLKDKKTNNDEGRNNHSKQNFTWSKDEKDHSDDGVNDSFKHAEFVLEKQNRDIISELVKDRKKKNYLALYITIGFVFLITILSYAGYLYRKELISNNKKELSLQKNTYEYQKKLLTIQISDLKHQYNSTLSLIKESNTNALNSEKGRVGELKEQIKTLIERERALIQENKLISKQNTDTQRVK